MLASYFESHVLNVAVNIGPHLTSEMVEYQLSAVLELIIKL